MKNRRKSSAPFNLEFPICRFRNSTKLLRGTGFINETNGLRAGWRFPGRDRDVATETAALVVLRENRDLRS